VTLQTGAPSIASISPNSATVGAQPAPITVAGENLIDAFGQSGVRDYSVSITGGVSASIGGFNDNATQATVTYSTLTSSNVGQQTLKVTNSFGASNGETFTVGYPPAQVTNVKPPSWLAGTLNLPVTITGQNFGTQPTLTISAPGASLNPGYTTTTNGQYQTINATVNIAANAPSEAVNITVQPGYAGSSFMCNCPQGQSPIGTYAAEVQQNLPPPTITIQNGGTNSPYAGQQVSLSVSPPIGGLTIDTNKIVWSFSNPADAVVNYAASAASGCYVPVAASGAPGECQGSGNLNNTQSTLGPFYFIVPGASEAIWVSVSYEMANGLDSDPVVATQAFTIIGPTGNLLPTAYDLNNDGATVLGNANGNPASLKMSNAPNDPNVNFNPNVGVRFDDLAVLPRGSLNWVQILNSVNYLQIAPAGYAPTSSNAAAQLDGVYPYPSASNNTTNDSPNRPDLLAGLGEGAISFNATMYALWDPAIPHTGQPNCAPATTDPHTYASTASTCASIPVPLGSVAWTWTPCAINTVPPPPAATGPSWVLKCGKGSVNPGTASGYPTWTSCHHSENGGC
jgi:hypothetical protein